VSAANLPSPRDGGGGLTAVSGSQSTRFRNALLNDVRAAIVPQGASHEVQTARLGAAMDALAGFAPRDEVEGMMAAQAVATHHAAMDALRRALAPGIPAETGDRLRRQATKLSQSFVALTDAIERRRGKSAHQVVRVEHVTVEAGAQAVIGAVVPRAVGGEG
jgi:hypothetical protein